MVYCADWCGQDVYGARSRLTDHEIVTESAVLRGKPRWRRDPELSGQLIRDEIIAAITDSSGRLDTYDVWTTKRGRQQRAQCKYNSENADMTLHSDMRNISNGAFPGKGILRAVVTHFQGPDCRDGHFRSAYEQNTQQSLGFGFSMTPQPTHW
jgi:hypothetical protein